MALRKRNKNHDRRILDANVNITALMDVLTVLLFFLIKSFSVSSSALNPPPGIRLPASEARGQAEETMTVSISKQDIRANSQLVMKLRNGRFLNSQIGNDGRTLLPLRKVLNTEIKKRNALFQGTVDVSLLPPAKILIQADKGIPYSLLKYLLHTATQTGYSDYQLVVINKEK